MATLRTLLISACVTVMLAFMPTHSLSPPPKSYTDYDGTEYPDQNTDYKLSIDVADYGSKENQYTGTGENETVKGQHVTYLPITPFLPPSKHITEPTNVDALTHGPGKPNVPPAIVPTSQQPNPNSIKPLTLVDPLWRNCVSQYAGMKYIINANANIIQLINLKKDKTKIKNITKILDDIYFKSNYDLAFARLTVEYTRVLQNYVAAMRRAIKNGKYGNDLSVVGYQEILKSYQKLEDIKLNMSYSGECDLVRPFVFP